MIREAHTEIWLCPTCGSAAVDRSMLVGTLSKCRVCKWEGPVTDLVAQQVKSDLLGDNLVQLLAGDLRGILGSVAAPLIKSLVKCRVIAAGDRDEAVFMRNRIAQSILRGVVEGAEELEKRRHAASKLFHRS